MVDGPADDLDGRLCAQLAVPFGDLIGGAAVSGASAGPRAVPGSQRVRPHRQREMGLSASSPSWPLRAGDGSRSGDSVRLLRLSPKCVGIRCIYDAEALL